MFLYKMELFFIFQGNKSAWKMDSKFVWRRNNEKKLEQNILDEIGSTFVYHQLHFVLNWRYLRER